MLSKMFDEDPDDLFNDLEFIPGAENFIGPCKLATPKEVPQKVSKCVGKKKKEKTVVDKVNDVLTFVGTKPEVEAANTATTILQVAAEAEKFVGELQTVIDVRTKKKLEKDLNPTLLEEAESFFRLHKEQSAHEQVVNMLTFQNFIINEDDNGGPMALRRPPPDGWVIEKVEDSDLVVVSRTSTDKKQRIELVKALPMEVISFLVQHHPRLAKRLRRDFNIILGEAVESMYDKEWDKKLHAEREFRYVNKALERYSKISQMANISDDTDMMMFDVQDGDEPDVIIGSQLHMLAEFFPDAEHLEYTKEFEGKYICSSVVVGDAVGAVGNDMKLLHSLNDLAAGDKNTVRVKLFMDDKLPDSFRGFLVSKGRPHNLVCVVQLDETADVLSELFISMYKDVQQANHERDMRYIVYKRPPLLPLGYNTYRFKTLLAGLTRRRKPKLEKVLRKEKYKNLVKDRRGVKFMEFCYDSSYVPDMKRFELGTNFDISGPLYNYDFDVGTAELMFNTLFLWATENDKRKLIFDQVHGWTVTKAN